jgi:hypothetical protein
MKYLFFILSLGITLMSTQCNSNESDSCHKNIKIVNNSDYNLVISISYSYPDSTSLVGFGERYESFNPPIPNHNVGKFQAEFYGCIEYSMKSKLTFENGVMMLFFFNKEVIENFPWETIVKNKMYLKKYDLTLEDLQAKDWTITYP